MGTPTVFTPRMSAALRAALIAGWHEALERALPGPRMADATNK
jgi:hypothetical protein